MQLAKAAEAVEHFREAARLDPASASPHYNIGTIARALGDTPQAIAEFREAVRLDPSDAEAIGSLAWLLATASSASLRNPGEALRLAEQAASIVNRRRAPALDILAAAQAANGQFDLAVATCDEALALNPGLAIATAIRQRRALYEHKRPYVMP